MKKLLSSLNNNTKKYITLAIALVALAGAIFTCAKIGISVGKPSNESTSPIQNENAVEAALDDFEEPETEEEYVLDLPAKFVPFECSGEFYSFNDLKNQYGFTFEYQDSGNRIAYIHNNAVTVLFETDNPIGGISFSMSAYIDNYLFFSVYQNKINTLYRIAFEYDGDGNIKSHDIYFVAENVQWPVKALNNTLIIEGYYGEYVSLNTKTGEINTVEYSNEVDPSGVKVSVSLDEAIKIAEKELEKDKYRVYNGEIYEKYIPNIDGIDPVLVHNPDIIYHKGYEDDIFEDYPEYVWVLRYDTEFLYQQVRIYVNAMSGEISYVQIQPYP